MEKHLLIAMRPMQKGSGASGLARIDASTLTLTVQGLSAGGMDSGSCMAYIIYRDAKVEAVPLMRAVGGFSATATIAARPHAIAVAALIGGMPTLLLLGSPAGESIDVEKVKALVLGVMMKSRPAEKKPMPETAPLPKQAPQNEMPRGQAPDSMNKSEAKPAPKTQPMSNPTRQRIEPIKEEIPIPGPQGSLPDHPMNAKAMPTEADCPNCVENLAEKSKLVEQNTRLYRRADDDWDDDEAPYGDDDWDDGWPDYDSKADFSVFRESGAGTPFVPETKTYHPTYAESGKDGSINDEPNAAVMAESAAESWEERTARLTGNDFDEPAVPAQRIREPGFGPGRPPRPPFPPGPPRPPRPPFPPGPPIPPRPPFPPGPPFPPRPPFPPGPPIPPRPPFPPGPPIPPRPPFPPGPPFPPRPPFPPGPPFPPRPPFPPVIIPPPIPIPIPIPTPIPSPLPPLPPVPCTAVPRRYFMGVPTGRLIVNAFPNDYPGVNWLIYRFPTSGSYLRTRLNEGVECFALPGLPSALPPTGVPMGARYMIARNGRGYWVFCSCAY